MTSTPPDVLQFGNFHLDMARRRLFLGQEPVQLQPKAFEALVYLAQRRDRVVTKEELFEALWPDTFVQDANLPQTISVLRRALGEAPQEGRFIATVPKRGYQFVAEVQVVADDSAARAHAVGLCFKGRHQLNKRLADTLASAITLFIEASDQDPSYAPAWVGLADAYALLSLYGTSMPKEAFPRSKAAALTALRLDPALASAHNALGVVALFYEWDWPGAERAFHRAIELDPAYGDVFQRYGLYLTAQQRFPEAVAALERAQMLDPLSRIIATFVGYPAYYSGDYEGAIRQFLQVLQIDPNFSMAHFRLGLAYAHQGRYSNALAELAAAKALSNDRDTVAAIGQVHGMMGHRAEAEAAIAELHDRSRATFVPSYSVAMVHAGLGDIETACDWLERAVDERSYWVMYFNVDPALRRLRGHPRFERLRERAGLLS